MKKAQEKDVLDKLIDNELEEKYKKKIDVKLFYGQIAMAVILFILLIISFINVRRTVLFSYLVFNNTMIIPIFLYITLILGLCYTLCIILMYIFGKKEGSMLITTAKLYKKCDLIRFIDLLLGFAFFVIVFIITPCNVVGDSMNDTLENGNRVVTTDLFYTEPKNGDIVTFDCSNYVKSSPMLYIKRVIASKDSNISYDANKMTISVDGKEEVFGIDTKEYARIYLTATDKYDVFDLTNEILLNAEVEYSFVMPKGKALVFGDNRSNSRDSEEFGAISTKDIFGHVLFRFGKKIEKQILD